jgi:hypothetical protein
MNEIPTISNAELGLSEKDIEKIVEYTWKSIERGSYKVIYDAEKDISRKSVVWQ